MGGQELFDQGESAKQMYFVVKGGLVHEKYMVDNPSACTVLSASKHMAAQRVLLSDKSLCHLRWCSEAALWLRWFHAGLMTGNSNTNLFALNCVRFQTEMSHCPS